MSGVPEKAEAEQELNKAHWLGWISIAYISSTIAMLFFIMSGSQALKTEMTGEILSLKAIAANSPVIIKELARRCAIPRRGAATG